MSGSEQRISSIRDLMSVREVEGVVIGPTNHMRYLLGNAPHADERLCLLLIGRDQTQMVVPQLNAQEIASFTDIPLITWEDAQGPEGALRASWLAGKSLERLAVDGSMRADFLLPLISQTQPREIISADPLLSSLRITKSPVEIEALAKAAGQADRAVQAAIEACRPGVTEQEVAWEAEAAYRRDGAQKVMFTLVAAGPNGARPHHHAGQKKLQRGEGVVIDIGASLNGYKSDITRMVFLGQPGEDFRQVYDLVLKANQAGRAAVRPGITAEEVDAAARRVIEEAGYGDYFIHRTGHGIGLDGHEAPWIMKGDKQVLEPGMAFSVEPGIYLAGKFGVRIEDIMVVTPEGARRLTGCDHQLIIK